METVELIPSLIKELTTIIEERNEFKRALKQIERIGTDLEGEKFVGKHAAQMFYVAKDALDSEYGPAEEEFYNILLKPLRKKQLPVQRMARKHI